MVYNEHREEKKILKSVVSCFVATIMLLSAVIITPGSLAWADTSSASELNRYVWYRNWDKNSCSSFSVDKKVHSGNSSYSIKLANNDYNASNLEKHIKVKPNTQYRFSAMVKYSGYKLSQAAEKDTGAGVGVYMSLPSGVNYYSERYNGAKWKKTEISFNTKENDEVVLLLRNGDLSSECKGEAWFSDIRLEEVVETTNRWNVLVLVVKHIKADAVVDGKTVKIDNKLNDNDVKYLKKAIQPLKKNLKDLSNGLVGINDIDVYAVEETVTQLDTQDKNKVPTYDPSVSKVIDKYTAKKEYQAIIRIVPLQGANIMSDGTSRWLGKGGGKYKGINICQFIYESGSKKFSPEYANSGYKDFPLSGIVHEMLHGVDNDSKAIDGEKTPDLHSAQSDYGYTDKEDGWFKCYSDYMTCNLPDGRGINPKAYYTHCVYKLVTDDMTTGNGVTVEGSLPTHISKVAKVSKIAAQKYTGKAVKPAVKVKGLSRSAYKVSYENNKTPGTAKAIIKGRGKYTGTIEVLFKIKNKKKSNNNSKNNNKNNKSNSKNNNKSNNKSTSKKRSKYDTGTNYFRNRLANKYEKEFYDKIKAQFEEFYWSDTKPKLENVQGYYYFGGVEFDTSKLSYERASRICWMFLQSNPKYFFSDSCAFSNNTIRFVVNEEFRKRSEINRCRNKIEKLTNKWMKDIKKIKDPLLKEEAIYGKILDHVHTYDMLPLKDENGKEMTDENGNTIKTVKNQNIVGAFVNRVCMCTGYSKAMAYLCNAAGIDCLFIWSGEHAYNMVKLYGNWYCIDLTWIDQNKDNHDSERVDKSSYNVNKSFKTFSQSGAESQHIPAEWYEEKWNIKLPTCKKDKVTK